MANERNDMIAPSVSTSVSAVTKSAGTGKLYPFKVYAVGDKHYMYRGTLPHAGSIVQFETTEIPAGIWREGRNFYPFVKRVGGEWKILIAYDG